eukprot:CAMPEP_0194199266 /NCGR_PEP_ID=MMETSP0156-20130528/350_1 /TAXON_ID=33649 /ORGANISM="Thalassionema nitzschioides, Strain L26-B" /LENGTH=354 /DNA_ID=CAMNT_0038924139 /DNA_START=54 /DNA_END=1118 /DNA_ORIENTATION=+
MRADITTPNPISDCDASTSPSDASCGGESMEREQGGDEFAAKFRPYQAEKWQERFQQLVEFESKHKHCLIPQTYPENPGLARWVKRQRCQYTLFQQNKKTSITEGRIKMLEDIGFVWDSHDATWQERFEMLLTFKKEHGHCEVPSKYEENLQLGSWVKCQRRQYKLHLDGKQSNITANRIELLENCGFKWEVRKSKLSEKIDSKRNKEVDPPSRKRKVADIEVSAKKQKTVETSVNGDKFKPSTISPEVQRIDTKSPDSVMNQLSSTVPSDGALVQHINLLLERVSTLENVVNMQQGLINRLVGKGEEVTVDTDVSDATHSFQAYLNKSDRLHSIPAKEIETAASLIELNGRHM